MKLKYFNNNFKTNAIEYVDLLAVDCRRGDEHLSNNSRQQDNRLLYHIQMRSSMRRNAVA